MFGQAVGVALLVAMATCSADNHVQWKDQMNMTRNSSGHMMHDDDLSPMKLLAQFRNASEARIADSNRDNRIDANELLQSLFLKADTNRDGRVDLAEFMDNYRRRFPFLPSEVTAVLFDLLDDVTADPGVNLPANFTPPCNPQVNVFSNVLGLGDDVLTQQDVSLSVFTQSNNPSVEDFQRALDTWVEEAAKRVHECRTRPFKVGKRYDVEFDYDLFFKHVDNNSDDIITSDELAAQMQRFNPSGRVSRGDWATRSQETYGQDRFVAMVTFDYLDDNDDLVLNADDVKKILMMADANHDDRTTVQEMYRLLQKVNKMVRRMLCLPIKPFMYDCPEPTWNDGDDCEPEIDATLLTMDVDYDGDGNVTVWEMQQLLSLMDHNMDHKVDRNEYIKFAGERYSQDQAVSDLEFDAADMDGDGYFSWHDYTTQYKGQEPRWMCACEYRLTAMASARAAKHLAKERKEAMDLTRMKYFVLMNEGLRSLEMNHRSRHGSRDAWSWKTMNGRPAMGGCTACTPRDNWGAMDQQHQQQQHGHANSSMSEEENRMVQMLMQAMRDMHMMEQWGRQDGPWRMMNMLMHAMHMLRAHAMGSNSNMRGEGNEMAQWNDWKMNTMMRMGQGQGSVQVMGQMQGQWGDGKGESDGQKMNWPSWMGWNQQEKKKDDDDDKEKGTFEKFMEWHEKQMEMQKEKERREREGHDNNDNNRPMAQWPQWQDWQGWQGWNGWQRDPPRQEQKKEEEGKDEEKRMEDEWGKFMKWWEEQQGKRREKEQQQQQQGGGWPQWNGGWRRA